LPGASTIIGWMATTSDRP
jgi:threonine dehydrogenase-like Zn-dependent dehydrogenase